MLVRRGPSVGFQGTPWWYNHWEIGLLLESNSFQFLLFGPTMCGQGLDSFWVNESFVLASQWTSVLYWRLADFKLRAKFLGQLLGNPWICHLMPAFYVEHVQACWNLILGRIFAIWANHVRPGQGRLCAHKILFRTVLSSQPFSSSLQVH